MEKSQAALGDAERQRLVIASATAVSKAVALKLLQGQLAAPGFKREQPARLVAAAAREGVVRRAAARGIARGQARARLKQQRGDRESTLGSLGAEDQRGAGRRGRNGAGGQALFWKKNNDKNE